MDATTTRFTSKTALFIAIALLIAAPGVAQAQLQVSLNSVTLGQSAQVGLTAGAGSINFRVTSNFGNGPSGWYSVSPTTGTTPTTLNILLQIAQPVLGSYSGTITVTNSANSSDFQTITVTYVPSSGTGGGGVTATPNSVTLPTAIPFQTTFVQTPVQLTTTSASAVSGSISAAADNIGLNWLSVSQTSFQTSSGSPASFNVVGNAASLAAGTYTGKITISPQGQGSFQIPVSLTVTGTGSLNVSPNPVNLAYPNGPLSQSGVTVTYPSCQFCTYSAAAQSSTNWLLVDGFYNFSGRSIGSSFTVSVLTTALPGSSGNFSGTVTIVASDNTSTVLNVNLNINGATGGQITVSPNPVSLSATGGQFQSTTLTINSINSGVSYTLTPTTSSGGSWLSVSPSSGTLFAGNNFVTVTASAAGLATGIYNGSLALLTTSGNQTISVTLTVNGGGTGGGTGGLVAPTSLAFSYQIGAVGPDNLKSNILVNAAIQQVTVSVNTGLNWLNAAPTSNNQVEVSVNPLSLTAGNYTGTVNIATNLGTASVSVNLFVTSGMVITSIPSAVIVGGFNAGDPLPQPTVTVYASDNSSTQTVASPSVSWVTITQGTSPNTPAVYGLKIDPTGLPNGLNTASLTITDASAANSPLIIPISVLVNSGGSTGIIQPSVTNLPIPAAINGSAVTVALGVTTASTNTFTVNATTQNGGNWLSVSPNTWTGSTNLQVTGNPAGLSQGTYIGTLTFLINGVAQSTVTVTMTVGTGSGTTVVTPTPTSLSYTYTVGSATVPNAQSLLVASTPTNSVVTVSYSTQNGGNWLSITGVNSGTTIATPQTLSVAVAPTSLAAGTYTGSVVLTPVGGGTAATVPVTLTVTSSNVSASPTSLSFTYQAGNSNPSAQTINVTSGGGQALPFTATASSNGNWLSVSPTSGTTGANPVQLQVLVNPSGLTAGNYTGTITVQGTGTASGTTTISVSLTVTAPLPTITKVSNAASYATGIIAPGELITIFGTSLGPQTPVQTQFDSNGRVATTLGNVRVLINGIAAPLVYVSSVQVTAVVPYEIKQFQTASVLVSFLGQTSNGVPAQVVTTNPGIFTANASGTGPAAALNQDFSVNSPSNPIAARNTTNGAVVTLYLTGEGETSPNGVTGQVTQARSTAPFTPAPLLPVGVTLDGVPVGFDFVGEAPSLVSGVLQLNVRVPNTARQGDLPVVVSIGGNPSVSGVTISVR